MHGLTGDLLADLPVAVSEELADTLVAVPGLRVERIVSTGQVSPPGMWYDQAEHEFVLVLAGAGTLEWADGSRHELVPGRWTWIPAHTRHRVAWTDPETTTVWLAVFVPETLSHAL